MRYSAAIVALAAASTFAFPAPEKRNDILQPEPLCEQFTVAFTVDGSYVSANAVKNGSSVLLQAQRLSVYPGTNAYINYSNPTPDNQFNYVALDFILDDGVYGASTSDVGEVYGLSVPVFLTKDYQQFEWLVNNGSIFHKLRAAPNSFYACEGTLEDGSESIFLSFGNDNYSGVSGPPAGCQHTQIIQNFNVQGGAQPSS